VFYLRDTLILSKRQTEHEVDHKQKAYLKNSKKYYDSFRVLYLSRSGELHDNNNNKIFSMTTSRHFAAIPRQVADRTLA
jgi:hypothetical protein